VKRWKAALAPSEGILHYSKGKMKEWIKQLAEQIRQISRTIGKEVKLTFDRMERTIDGWTDGRFSYLIQTAKRWHI
jgi:hypothetical protein